MYHNPDTMEIGCDEVADSGVVATNKEGIANQIRQEGNAILWCIGRTLEEDEEDIFWLYQRIESPTVEEGDGVFAIHLVGTPTFPENASAMVDVTEKPYFPKLEKLLRFGVQRINDNALIGDLQAEFTKVWRKKP